MPIVYITFEKDRYKPLKGMFFKRYVNQQANSPRFELQKGRNVYMK
jgi:hypothetical protein